MSLMDQFPEASGFEHPSWLLDDATDDDLLGAARSATLESLRQFDPSAIFPLRLDLRLFGKSVDSGAFDFRASPILQRFDQELQAVLPDQLKEIAKLQFVSISAGSVVVHARPQFAQEEEGTLDLAAVSQVGAAIDRVLDLHDSIEGASSAINVPAEQWENLRKLTKAMDNADVNLEVDVLRPSGPRRVSMISEQGRAYARDLFSRKNRTSPELIIGTIFSAGLNGKMVIQTPGPRVEIDGLPANILESEAFRLGRFIRINVDKTVESDGVGGQVQETRRFREIVGHDDPIPDSVE